MNTTLIAAAEAAYEDLVLMGILVKTDTESGYTTPDKGKAWVEMICHTPMPQLQWANPINGEVMLIVQ